MIYSTTYSYDGILAHQLKILDLFLFFFYHPWHSWGHFSSGLKQIRGQNATLAP